MEERVEILLVRNSGIGLGVGRHAPGSRLLHWLLDLISYVQISPFLSVHFWL